MSRPARSVNRSQAVRSKCHDRRTHSSKMSTSSYCTAQDLVDRLLPRRARGRGAVVAAARRLDAMHPDAGAARLLLAIRHGEDLPLNGTLRDVVVALRDALRGGRT